MTAKRDLREACIKEALKIIEKRGVENLSLREVARRLRISHQAPYVHFRDKDHIVAEIVRRGFETFERYLREGSADPDPRRAMAGLGRAYFAFALENPLYYRLMFTTPLPDPRAHPELKELGETTYAILKDRLQSVAADRKLTLDIDADSMFVWSAIHGLALILQSDLTTDLHLASADREKHMAHLLKRIGDALGVNS